MSCESVKLSDGSVVLVNVKAGQKLTEEDKQALKEYVEFCRKRAAKKKAKERK